MSQVGIPDKGLHLCRCWAQAELQYPHPHWDLTTTVQVDCQDLGGWLYGDSIEQGTGKLGVASSVWIARQLITLSGPCTEAMGKTCWNPIRKWLAFGSTSHQDTFPAHPPRRDRADSTQRGQNKNKVRKIYGSFWSSIFTSDSFECWVHGYNT
jgi:hypothetical protein